VSMASRATAAGCGGVFLASGGYICYSSLDAPLERLGVGFAVYKCTRGRGMSSLLSQVERLAT